MIINNSLCGVCEACIDVCPRGIIEKKGFKVVINEGCDNCGECLDVCPVGAIEFEE